jgi:hypothetical protein
VTEAEKQIDSLSYADIRRYSSYLLSVAPRTQTDFFRRWLFSLASIQTSWQQNVELYNAVRRLDWLDDQELLMKRIKSARTGLYNHKCKAMWEFSRDYWEDPSKFYGKPGESWVEYRDRLMGMIYGLGPAKTAFVLEMTWPCSAEICCLDRHIIRMFGEDSDKISDKKMRELEEEWVRLCRRRNVAPAIARSICWDKVQQEDDSRYWCWVFHTERPLLSRLLA